MPLRPLRASDLAALASWLPPLAADLACERWASEEALRDAIGEAFLYSEPAGAAFISYTAGAFPPDAVQIDFLAVQREHRRLGIGSRAALALERKLKRTAAKVYVRVPSRLGLALYFWLRLGYRPLTQRDWPAAADETAAWMVRELA